jgi:hypothetical protein
MCTEDRCPAPDLVTCFFYLAEGRREESTNIELVSLPPNKERKLIIRYCPGKVPMKPPLKSINYCILDIFYPFYLFSRCRFTAFGVTHGPVPKSTRQLLF